MKMRGMMIRGLVASLLLGAAMAAPAGATEDEFGNPLWKLTRGLTNIAIGFPAEVLKQAFEGVTGEDENTAGAALAGTASGTAMGLGWGLARVGSGIVDFLTFPIPFNDNRPLVEPEFPL